MGGESLPIKTIDNGLGHDPPLSTRKKVVIEFNE